MENTVHIQARRREEAARLLERLRALAPPVLAAHPVDAAYVYGSAARGAMTPFSDVDIALLLREPLPPYERLMLELTIQGEIEDALGYEPVDVRVVNEAPLMARGRVVQEGILIYERERRHRVTFEVATRKQYFDFAPAARRLQEAFIEHVYRKGLTRG